MKLLRVSTLIAFACAVASGTGLFVISQRVQRAEHHLAALQDSKAKEQDSIHVLRAEWDYLNRPDRLEALSRQYLDMQSPDLSAVTSDPGALTAPLDVVAPARKPASTMSQPAVYRPQVPAAPASAADQNSFQDLIHNLSGEGGQ